MGEAYTFLLRAHCATYNHSPYITDALNGFVMQKTDFPFVCTIMDDASTDGEQEVIKKYMQDFFDLQDASVAYERDTDYGHVIFAQHKTNKNCFFAVILLQENHYSQKKSKAPYLTEWLNTKYIALCEGDDYWIDPMKLQKQVFFLETHPEYDMVCTRFNHKIYEEGKIIPSDLYDRVMSMDIKGLEIKQEHFIKFAQPHPCTVMYRSGSLDDNDIVPKLKYKFDLPMYYCFLYQHRIWLMGDKTAVHVLHKDSLTRQGRSNMWNMYLGYADILKYVPNDKILMQICAIRYRNDYLLPNSLQEKYGFKTYLNNLREYIFYKPSFRNVVSATIKILKNRIRFKRTISGHI